MMRKKLVIIMSLIISAAAAGCAKAAEYSEPGALPKDFDKKASVVCCGREYEAELRRGNDSAWEISFTAPECIEGLTITSTDGDCIFNYSGLEYFARGTALPDSGMLPLLSGAIDKVISAEDISVRTAIPSPKQAR